MNRIESLRRVALSRTHSNDEFFYLFYKSYSQNKTESEYERYADAFDFAFSELTPNITEGELIVGEINGTLSADAKREWIDTYKEIAEKRCAEGYFREAGRSSCSGSRRQS